MHAGWFRAGTWVLLAILASGAVCAYAYPSWDGRRDGNDMRDAPSSRGYDARGARNARGDEMERGERMERAPRGYGAYDAMPPEDADERSMPRQPFDPALRGGSIREDVTRYNEERRAARSGRPFSRGGAEPGRGPSPFSYRNY